ncbi:MAG: DUF2617 family protein [Phycisphaerales bacterium]|nr:DUF2617 family protein [Phycisphaerales bacterium]
MSHNSSPSPSRSAAATPSGNGSHAHTRSANRPSINTAAYQVILYQRALHPELFTLKGRKLVKHGGYEFEAWLMPGAHLIRFQHKGLCACELVTHQEDHLPTDGALTTFPCAGERDFEHPFEPSRANYMTSVQTENLSENLYTATYSEMVAFARECDGMLHRWEEPLLGRCLSLLDIQRYTREVHVQSYHLIGAPGYVLRTQSIFEHN